MKLSNEIRSIRKSKSLTQSDLARRLNMSKGVLDELETKEPSELDPKQVREVANALGVQIQDVLLERS